MKIAVLAHIRHPVAEPFMGGMESHCHTLVRALERRGHSVTLFAAGGSKAADMRPICAQPYEATLPWTIWRGTPELAAFQHAAFSRAWREIAHAKQAGPFDVVHNNSLYPAVIAWAARDGVPLVTSQHVPPFGQMRDQVTASFGDNSRQVTVTSAHQLELWSDTPVANLSVVHNGIDIAEWSYGGGKNDRFVWSGRITETKGLREAVQAARQTGAKLDIIGTTEDREYFGAYVAPFLGDDIRYLGHLSGPPLMQAIGSAKAAIVTPMWDEPFGLVAAEALACGTPVIAFDRGAMREVVGDCGVIVSAADVQGLAKAMAGASLPSPRQCRERAKAMFSVEQMIAGYERCYAAAIHASAEASSASSARSTAELLA